MWSTAREIAAGDMVIIWMTRDLIQPLTITPGATLHNKFGYYPHDSLIGKPYGSKVLSQSGKGFLYVLRPTPELWTLALPHRTQILYLADIAFITEWLGIKMGSRVVEAGTGSASFSHSLARTVGPTGKVYSFEFHEMRAAKAREEFERHGMSSFVTLQHRNVCKDGFADVVDEVDAVFLDLPAPWDAIPHAKKSLRKDHPARICCFSPCIEQVLRTVTALNEAGFTEITTYETLLRPVEVSIFSQGLKSVDAVTEELKRAEVKREEKRLRQIKANREKEARDKEKAKAKGGTGDAKTGEGLDAENASTGKRKYEDTNGVESKRLKTDESTSISLTTLPGSSLPSSMTLPGSSSSSTSLASLSTTATIKASSAVSKALPEVRGHTSYLTFACLVPYERYKPQDTDSSSTGTKATNTSASAPAPTASSDSLTSIPQTNHPDSGATEPVPRAVLGPASS